jgi:MPBQ/MSBQ methyltransferase
MGSKLTKSLLFISAGLLLGITSLVAFILVIKEKVEKHMQLKDQTHAFLATEKRALAYYTILSPVYDLVNPHFYTTSMRDEIVKLSTRDHPTRVLDVGCGTGYTTAGILRLPEVCEAIGIDQNCKQLQKAARNLGFEKARISLSRGNVMELPFKDESFDAVVSVGAIEYFPDPAVALAEMARVVKHQGRVVVGGPEFNWFKKFLFHKLFYTPERGDFERLFLRLGLKEVTSMLTGVKTFFGTDKYVLIVAGTKE